MTSPPRSVQWRRVAAMALDALESRHLFAGPAAKLAFIDLPSSGSAGTALATFSVVVEDASGNLVPQAPPTFTFTGSALDGGTTVFSTSPVATTVGTTTNVTGVTLDRAGYYSFDASAPGLSDAISPEILISAGAPASALITSEPSTTTAGVAIGPVTLALSDAFGNAESGGATPITVVLDSGSGGSASFSGTASQTVAGDGSVTFPDLSETVAGSGYRLKFFSGAQLLATSSPFSVIAAAGANLAFVKGAAPQNGTAGQQLAAISLDATDAYGNVVTNIEPSITVTANGSTAAFAGTPSSSISGGGATVTNIILDAAKTYQLTFSATGLTAISGSITISAGTPAQLAISGTVAATTLGNPFAGVNVEVEDAFGNLATSDSGRLVSAALTGPKSLTGTLEIADAQGAATFSDLVGQDAGAFTLAFSSPGLTGASQQVTIVKPQATSASYVGSPTTNATAGSTVSAYSVSVADQAGFPVPAKTRVSLAVIGTANRKYASQSASANARGIATFRPLSLTRAGTYSVEAMVGKTVVSTSPLTIAPAVATTATVVVSARTVAAGAPLSFSVTALDKYRNTASAGGSVMAELVNSSTHATTTYTSSTETDGAYVFNVLSPSTPGNYNLHVSGVDIKIKPPPPKPIHISAR